MFDPAPTTIRTSPTFTPIKHVESETLRRLRAARERISDKAHWCTGLVDLNGRVCVIGAMALAAGFTLEALAARAWQKANKGTPYSSAVVPTSLQRAAHTIHRSKGGPSQEPSLANVWYVNDIFGHAAALSMLDRAIEIEQQQQHSA